MPASVSYRPATNCALGCASVIRRPGSGRQIWPAWRCPDRIRSKAPRGIRLTIPGKWQSNSFSAPRPADRVRAGLVPPVALRVDSDDDDRGAACLDLHDLVPQQSRAFQIAQLSGFGERIAGYGHVVVSEHDERGIESGEQRSEQRLSAGMRHEVSRDADEVRSALGDPVDGTPAA